MIATGRAQADLNAMLAHYAALYEVVVRLKGGDPYVFGRGGEEAFALLNAGHHVEVVPGLSSALAAPAAAGIPLTHRGRSHGFTVVTAASAHDVAGVDWFGIARLDHTLVVLMGVRLAPHIATALIAGGRSPDEPVAVIGSATTACQQVERTTLARLAQVRVPAPATIVIGDVAGFEGLPVWQGDHLTTHHGTAHKGTAHKGTALLTTTPSEAQTVSAYAHAPLGDITTAQFRALADAQCVLGASMRLTNRQNLVFRDLQEHQLHDLYRRLAEIGMASAGAELLRDVVACPGADTCNLAVTQSRGLAEAITDALEEAGLAEVPGLRINISGCMNSCGQHHVADIGFFGIERRVEAKSAPGYQLLLGGHVGQEQIKFGSRTLRLPAKNAPHAVVRIVERYVGERNAGETFATWLERAGGASAVARSLRNLDRFDTEEHFADFNETGPFAVAVGESECL